MKIIKLKILYMKNVLEKKFLFEKYLNIIKTLDNI